MVNEKLLRTFALLGADFTGASGSEELVGTCPFCGKENHLYWNVEKEVWHCFRCNERGRAMELISGLLQKLQDETDANMLAELARDRRLPVAAMEGYGIAYSGGMFILPVYGFDGRLASIRSYRCGQGQKLRILGGCPASLFGAEKLSDPRRANEVVYLCEGEWDAIALDWFLRVEKAPGVVVGAPGAGSFKEWWAPHFRGRRVHLAYDNDAAGRDGMIRTGEILMPHVSFMLVLLWPHDTLKGYDIRDWVIDKLKH
jgi:hypothetical protein